MSATNLLKEWKVRTPNVENILIFVSDALRWDFAPTSVLSQGVAFRAVASGVRTAISFPSIVTGLHPWNHKVHSFYQAGLEKDISSLLNVPGYNTSVWTENCWLGYEPLTSAPLYSILGCKNRVPLENLEPPFIYLEDEKGGHCPYGWSTTNTEYEEWDCAKFFRDFGKKDEQALKAKYREGVQRSTRVFEDRLRVINERGLAETTLVVFLSDHGESLGEHGGIVGHWVTTPEVVYVPVVLIHPDLQRGTTFENEGVLRHVDLYPTIMDLLKRKTGAVDGVNLFNEIELPTHGLTYFEENIHKGVLRFNIRELSVWDRTGGYMFREQVHYLRLIWALYLTALSRNSLIAIYQRQKLRRSPIRLKDFGKLLSWLSTDFMKCGEPSFSANEATSYIQQAYESKSKERVLNETHEMEDQKLIEKRLKALGYID